MGAMYWVNPRCASCGGNGEVEILSRCCVGVPAWAKECGCGDDGYTVDDAVPCSCLQEAKALGSVTARYTGCPDCEGWGRRVYIYASREVYPGGSFPSEEHYEEDCEPCKGKGYRRVKNNA